MSNCDEDDVNKKMLDMKGVQPANRETKYKWDPSENGVIGIVHKHHLPTSLTGDLKLRHLPSQLSTPNTTKQGHMQLSLIPLCI